jgi:hypothetical protein
MLPENTGDRKMSEKGPRFDKTRKNLHQDGWTCPKCGHHHDASHWKDHHQIDDEKTNKKYCENGFCKTSQTEHELENGVPKPLYCPCCGFEEDRLVIVKVEKGDVVYV